MSDDFIKTIFIALLVWFVLFIIGVYIVRAIFNIPGIVRLHRAQMRLLEEIAKAQGVDGTKVKSIISETYGWDGAPTPSAPATPQPGNQ